MKPFTTSHKYAGFIRNVSVSCFNTACVVHFFRQQNTDNHLSVDKICKIICQGIKNNVTEKSETELEDKKHTWFLSNLFKMWQNAVKKEKKTGKHSYICSDGSLLQSICVCVCVCVEGKFGPVGSLLILTIYKTIVHSHTFMHRQEKQREAQAHIQTSRL